MDEQAIRKNPQQYLVQKITEYMDKPYEFSNFIYPWQVEGSPLEHHKIDDWQRDLMKTLEREIHKRRTGEETKAIRLATASGHGIGKSCLVSMIIHWFMSTRVNPQIIVTANTEAQLKTKTWRELAKWNQLAINGDMFTHTATSYYNSDKKYSKTWFATAIPWNEEKPEGFAGTHEKDVLVIFDEASAIPDVIWETVEGAMTTPGAIWLCFGNPTKNSGRFYDCWNKFRHRWLTFRVDSRTARMANNAEIDQWIEDYGEDSDFVRVRVRGLFPRLGSKQFISTDTIQECVKYKAIGYEHMPTVLSCDVARFGDDQTVFCVRQGRKVEPLIKYRGLDTMETADRAVDLIKLYNPAMTIVDGIGVGAGVVDRLRQLGFPVIDCNVANKARDFDTYHNKRAEMWGTMREAMREGLDIPDDTGLIEGLTGIEYDLTPLNRILLEKKEVMKKRGLPSPDEGDALAMTFSEPITDTLSTRTNYKPVKAKSDYLGFDELL